MLVFDTATKIANGTILIDRLIAFLIHPFNYRVTSLVANLGWVDLDLGSSPGWWPLL